MVVLPRQPRTPRHLRMVALAHLPYVLVLLAVVYHVFGALVDGYVDRAHDGHFNGLRVAELQEEIAAGFFPPQLLNSAFMGAGHAFPVFYPPLSLWVTVAIATATGSVTWGVNLSMFLSVLASALTMYIFGFAAARQRIAALAVALCYTCANYRLVDTHLRGALAESWSFFWYPLVLLAVWRIARQRGGGPLLALSLAGAALTHTITLMYFVVLLAPVTVILWTTNGHQAVRPLILGSALAVGISAFYLVPAMAWLPHVLASLPEYMLAGWDSVVANRVPAINLVAGTLPVAEGPEYDFRMAPQLMGAAVVMTFLLGMPRLGAGRLTILRRRMAIVAVAMAFVYTLFTVTPELFRFLPTQFSYIQFPWRALGLAITMLAAAMAWGAMSLRRHRHGRHAWIALCALFILSPSGDLRFRDYDFRYDESSYTKDERAAHFMAGIGYTVLGEYAPRSFVRDPRLGLRPAVAPKLQVVQGVVGSLGFERTGPGQAILTVDAPGPARIRLPLMHYPFWRAVDGRGRQVEILGSHGLVELRLTPGITRISLTRFYPPVQIMGMIITMVSLVLLTVVVARRRRLT